MSRKEIVALVSRALALMFAIPSVIGFLMIVPVRLITFAVQQSSLPASANSSAAQALSIEGTSMFISLVGVVLHLLAAWLFWSCPPVVERWFLPQLEDSNA